MALNEEAVSVLRLWREQSGTGARVFGVTTGFQSAWEKVLKRARTDTPWYPSATLYRQERMGTWEGVVQRVTRDLCSAATTA
jgi:hypothetical protein